MDETPFFRKPWFYIFSWLVILLIVYSWQIMRMGGIQASLFDIFIDLACIFPVLLILWMAFFAQFVLPVRTLEDRIQVFNRLLTGLFGGNGLALFIENGVIKEHPDDQLKRGAGVVWLDSASAAVTRTDVKIKKTLGPGVHFIDGGEYIASTLDLHIQSQTLGPEETDILFAENDENGFEDGYDSAQERRKMVSALTRDGIEVVPTISIQFRVDTGYPKDNEPGSRFGYRTGISRKAKENEEKDKEAIRKALLGEGVNPNYLSEMTRRRVAWNELPASLAVDVWREYASKFTLDELFKPEQIVPPSAPEPPQPTDEELDPLSQPIQITGDQTSVQNRFAVLLREINIIILRMIRWLEGSKPEENTSVPAIAREIQSPAPEKQESVKKTGLQVINEMVNARLKKPEVDVLDDHGTRGQGVVNSPEYQLLRSRGIAVLSVGIGNIRLNPEIEDTIIQRWSASWFDNARAESKQIERRRNIVKSAGQEKAIRQYSDRLSRDLIHKKPFGVKETLKTLLMRTRTIIINDDQLRKDMAEEQEGLEDILRWIEEDE